MKKSYYYIVAWSSHTRTKIYKHVLTLLCYKLQQVFKKQKPSSFGRIVIAFIFMTDRFFRFVGLPIIIIIIIILHTYINGNVCGFFWLVVVPVCANLFFLPAVDIHGVFNYICLGQQHHHHHRIIDILSLSESSQH